MGALLHYSQQMRDFFHHAAESRRIRPLDDSVHLLQSERADDDFMFFRAANGAADELDLDFSRHFTYTLSKASPRRSAISCLSRNCSSAAIVAFTTLCGL